MLPCSWCWLVQWMFPTLHCEQAVQNLFCYNFTHGHLHWAFWIGNPALLPTPFTSTAPYTKCATHTFNHCHDFPLNLHFLFYSAHFQEEGEQVSPSRSVYSELLKVTSLQLINSALQWSRNQVSVNLSQSMGDKKIFPFEKCSFLLFLFSALSFSFNCWKCAKVPL